jgi:glycosyltransferase involved in cell wall biosynthesis
VADLLKVVHDDTHLVLLGDGPLRWRGQRFCQQVEIMDRVHLVAECCKLDRWLAYANFFWEVDGLQASASFTMRAMASGVPVIAVDTPANRALLGRDGGLYFQVGHRAGLARQTESILNDDALANGLSDRARQRVADRFSINRMVESHVQLYRELAA